MLGKIEGGRRRGWQRMRWLDGITFSVDMGLSNSRSWRSTGRPCVLQPIGSQRVRHIWATELNWCAQWLGCVWLFVTLWTGARQATLSKRFSRQENWSGLPFPPPGDITWPRYLITYPTSVWQADCLPLCHLGSSSSSCCSVTQSCPTLWYSMDCSTLGFPVHHQLPELAQTHVHLAIQPSHPLWSHSTPAFNLSQHHFQWINSLHQVAKVLDLQLQHQYFQWIFRVDFF